MDNQELLNYINIRLEDLWKALGERQTANNQRFSSQEEAIHIASSALDKRLEGVNEFRAQLTSQAATFATRDLHYQLADLTNQQFREVGTRIGAIETRMLYYVGLGAVAGAGLISLLKFLLQHAIGG